MDTEGAVIRKISWCMRFLMLCLSDNICTDSDFSPAFLFWKKENMGIIYSPRIMQTIKPHRTQAFSPGSLTVDGTVNHTQPDISSQPLCRHRQLASIGVLDQISHRHRLPGSLTP